MLRSPLSVWPLRDGHQCVVAQNQYVQRIRNSKRKSHKQVARPNGREQILVSLSGCGVLTIDALYPDGISVCDVGRHDNVGRLLTAMRPRLGRTPKLSVTMTVHTSRPCSGVPNPSTESNSGIAPAIDPNPSPPAQMSFPYTTSCKTQAVL